jgi:hypothetical protein
MSRQSSLVVALAGSVLLGAASTATAVTLSAPNSCSTWPYCGASFLSGQWSRPGNSVWEEQYFLVDVSASALLQSTGEHLAMSAFANSQPFDANNAWVGPLNGQGLAPNGGIGIALGAINSSSWRSCLSDPTDTNVEFAIERFGYQGTTNTRILDCEAVSKSTLSGVSTLRVEFYATCSFGSCNASATLSNTSTSQVYATLGQGAITLQNTSADRDIWYGLLNVSTSSVSATYSVVGESYTSAP